MPSIAHRTGATDKKGPRAEKILALVSISSTVVIGRPSRHFANRARGGVLPGRRNRGRVSLLTRTGLDWTRKYRSIAAACLLCR